MCGPASKSDVVMDLSLADDLVIAVMRPNAVEAVGALAGVVASVIDVFVFSGAKANLASGKSECMLAMRGNQATVAKQDVFGGGPPAIRGQAESGPFEVGVVFDYKHMGSVTCANMNMMKDVKMKGAAAADFSRPLHKKCFANPDLDPATRLALSAMCLASRQEYSVSTWLVLPRGPRRAFHSNVVGMYRRAVAMTNFTGSAMMHSDARVLAQACVKYPSDVLAVSRLRLFRRMVLHGPDQLWSVLKAEAGPGMCDENAWLGWSHATWCGCTGS
jgi:hypothetical protein